MAPEVIKGAYGQPADVYSFGLMLWELWYRRRIYTSICLIGSVTALEEFIQFMMKGNRPDMPADDLPPWADLIQSCWKGSPVERPLFKDVVLKLEDYNRQADIHTP
jgi:serine/threonine protein kinase